MRNLKKLNANTRRNDDAIALRQTDNISEIMKNLQKDLERIAIPTANKVVLKNTGKLLFLASKSRLTVIGAIKETTNIGEIPVKMSKG